jgi:diguanylate cyclase (GGDEF)-like protein/PAS domain S-box-containing protein
MLPAVVAVPTILGVLRWYGERLGLWNAPVGIFLLVVAVAAVMCVLVWRMAAWLEGTERVRRAALADLREADERFAGAFDHASVGMAIVTPDGAFSQVNDELCRIAGRARDDLLALSFQEITHPDDLKTDLDLLDKLVAGEIGNYQMEKRYRHAAGHYVWILLGVSLVRGDDGAPRYFVCLIQDITDRKRAGAALRMQAEMAEHLSEGVCMLRPGDGEVIYANPAFDRMLGCPSGYHVGRESPLPLGYTRETISAEIGEAIARDGRWGAEVEYRRMDGSTLWCHIGVSRFEDPEHGALSVVIQTDISARREAEERLAHQHTQLVEAQSIARMGSWEYDLRTKQTRWSDQQFRIYGLDPAGEAPDADGYLALVHPEDRSLAAAGGPTAGEREYRVVRPDGVEVIVHTSTEVAEADADGNPVRVAGTAQDVTERREAEAALRDAENLFRGAFEDAPIGMALASLDGRFMQVNAALATITGFSREHLTGMPFEQVTHPDDRGNDEVAFEELTAGQRSSYNVEKRYVHSDGRPVWVAVNVNLIRGAGGEPRHFLTQVQDVTERRRYESRLQHMADHDPLTGLLNRRSFERELRAQTARMRRYGAEGAAILIDVDNFKAVNDTLGHHAGDELIVRVARALHGRLRDTDVLARMGGDEFAVLLPKEGATAATEVAQALLERIRQETRPTRGSSRPGNLTASVGVAAFGDEGTLTGDDVLLRADVAMYEAKAAGRDQVALHRPEQHA